jgi:hypothetical protein
VASFDLPARAPVREVPHAAMMVGFAALLAAFLTVISWAGDPMLGVGGPDSLMRLVEVRDLLAGQGWFDLTQYRLAPPDGVYMHWSRLVDAPIAGLVLAFTPIAGRAMAETIAYNIWPPIVSIPFLVVLAAVARPLAGTAGSVLTVLAIVCSPAVAFVFRPGMIDHHNVQLVAVAVMLAALAQIERRAAGLVLGMAAAFSLTVGLEQVAFIGVVGVLVALRWMWLGSAGRDAAVGFGSALGGGIALFFVATVPAARWAVAACDALSPVYLVLGGVGGGGLAVLAKLSSGSADPAARALRAGGLAGIGAAVVATIALAFPNCLGGPYADLDPRLYPVWLAYISEARGVVAMAKADPAGTLAHLVPPLMALVAGGIALFRSRPEERWTLIFLTTLLAVTLGIALMQIRGVVTAQTVAAPLAALIICKMRQRFTDDSLRGIAARLGGIVFVPLFWWPVALFLLDNGRAAAAADTNDANCRDAAMAALQGEPRGIVAAPSNMGSYILAMTPHEVISAPYHRNTAGILAAADIWQGDAANALDVVRHWSASYLALCPAGPEERTFLRLSPDGFLHELAEGEIPAWLRPVAAGDGALVFAVVDPGETGSIGGIRGTIAPSDGLAFTAP